MEDKLSLSINTSYLFAYDKETGNWRREPYPNTYALGEVKIEIYPDSELE